MRRILPALLHDPLVILAGIVTFTANLLLIPFFYKEISHAIVTLIGSGFYMLITCSKYIFLSKQQLLNLLDLPEEERNENRLWLMLCLIEKFIVAIIFRPRLIIEGIKSDMSCSGEASNIIRYKFKTLFIFTAVIYSCMCIFLPETKVCLGQKAISTFFCQTGIETTYANFGACFIISGLIYATRTFIVGLGLIACHCLCSSNLSFRQSMNDHQNIRQDQSSTNIIHSNLRGPIAISTMKRLPIANPNRNDLVETESNYYDESDDETYAIVCSPFPSENKYRRATLP